jgi:sterol desaturase/sphingolipid hydroxylase (fatty acid hydroxylase superfamily)
MIRTLTTLFAGAALVAIGAAAWTLGEYLMHRFAMHALKGRGMASREHLTHHAQYDSVLEKWWFAWMGVVAVGVAFGVNATHVIGAVGWCLGVGWVGGYGFYDWLHFRAHRRTIRRPASLAGTYERYVRRHHFHHHFGHPTANHGVTTPVWDLVFGTYERVEGPVKVPRRLAMRWLVDADGELLPGYEHDWVLVGRKLIAGEDPAQDSLDRARAFANLAPTA